MEEAEAQARVGTLLCGKWTLDRLLGVGGMAAVYAATHKIGRRDAIKILHPEVARVKEMRSRFELEAHVANRFKHPGAVEIRDVDKTEDGCPFFVMELLEGESLTDVARRGPVDVGALLGWMDALLDTLTAAHAEGIIHRDVKLDNLFVTKDGRLKVLDFGIARVRDAQAQGFQKTAMGARLGTATYMPPEQVQGRDIDGRADIFAVGATMFRLVARRRIHEAPTEAETLVKMGSQPAPPLASVADAPPFVCLIVDRALRFQREDRYPDAATMRADVRAVRGGAPPPYATERAGADASMKSTMAVRSVRSAELETAREPAAAAPVNEATRVELDPKPSPKIALGQTAPAISVREVPASVAYAVEMDAGPMSAGPASFAATVAGPSSIASTPRAAQHATVATASARPGTTGVLSIPSAPTSRGPTPLIGTLKSAGIVPLPDHPPPSAPLVAVESAPQLAPKKSNLRLVLFGAAFLVLGVVVTVIAAWPSAPAGRNEGVDLRKPAPAQHKKH